MSLKPSFIVIIGTCVLLSSLSVLCLAVDLELKQCHMQCKKLERATEEEEVKCKQDCVRDYVHRLERREKEQPPKKENEVVANGRERDDDPRREECREGQRHCEEVCLGGRGRVKLEKKSKGDVGREVEESFKIPYVFGEEHFVE